MLENTATTTNSREPSGGTTPGPNRVGFGPLIGKSEPMVALYDMLKTVGPSTASALIVGESGTGKELVARTLHELSHRRDGPFVPLNCAAVPETLIESELFGHEKGAFTGADSQKPGCFEIADGGTLLLDEIAAMPLVSQVKLLRVLEEKVFRRLRGSQEIEVNVRVIAAMNEDPREAVRRKRLRPDLLFRLNVFTIRLPPLRERVSDIPLLALQFARDLGRRNGKRLKGLDPETTRELLSHPWPGNVRELRNVIERAAIMEESDTIRKSSLPPLAEKSQAPSASPSEGEGAPAEPIARVGMTIDEATRRLILRTLEATNYNKTKAADLLGISSKTVYNKLKQWNVKPPDGARSSTR